MSSLNAVDQKTELSLQELKDLLASQLCDPERLKRPEGLATGFKQIDDFLLWNGLPKGALTLLCGQLGTGATSLWMQTATNVIGQNLWAAWINGDVPLAPQSLYHKGVNLRRFVCVEKPPSETKLFWLLQEMMSSSLFDLIGCDLGSLRLREHQLRKLQTQAREAHVGLILMSQLKPYRGSTASIFSLIVHFEKKQISIERALHRPTPHQIPRSVTYARFTLHTTDSAENRDLTDGSKQPANSSIGENAEPSALSEAPRTPFSRF